VKEPELFPTAQERNSEPTEIKVLEALNDASYSLSGSMRIARSRSNKNALRNYRRKRSNVKKLHAEVGARVAKSMTPTQNSCASEFPDVVKETYVLSVKAEKPNDLRKLIRQAIMDEFWTRTLKRPAKFPGCGTLTRPENNFLHSPTLVSSYHITADSGLEENKSAAIANGVPTPVANAPHADELQQQFQQLQA
jgi:hypothetical protein